MQGLLRPENSQHKREAQDGSIHKSRQSKRILDQPPIIAKKRGQIPRWIRQQTPNRQTDHHPRVEHQRQQQARLGLIFPVSYNFYRHRPHKAHIPIRYAREPSPEEQPPQAKSRPRGRESEEGAGQDGQGKAQDDGRLAAVVVGRLAPREGDEELGQGKDRDEEARVETGCIGPWGCGFGCGRGCDQDGLD